MEVKYDEETIKSLIEAYKECPQDGSNLQHIFSYLYEEMLKQHPHLSPLTQEE